MERKIKFMKKEAGKQVKYQINILLLFVYIYNRVPN
jgi:hypothetical protein